MKKKDRRWAYIYISIVLIFFAIVEVLLRLRLNGAKWDDLLNFEGKGLWDLLDLLLIPVSLIILGSVLDTVENQRTIQNRLEEQRETALQVFLQAITSLILDHDLLNATNQRFISLAQIRLNSIIPMLDGRRKGLIVEFLADEELISSSTTTPKLNLNNLMVQDLVVKSGLNLKKCQFIGSDLRHSNLKGVRFSYGVFTNANLAGSDLTGAILDHARFRGADLRNVILAQSDLYLTNFSRADLRGTNLESVKKIKQASFKEAFYNYKTKWPKDINPRLLGALYKK